MPIDGAALAAVGSFGGRRVLVVGDAMLDRYILGEASRISPEAPVPVIAASGRSSSPGGAANAAANIVALGAEAELLAIVGDDADGTDLGALLEAGGVRSRLIASPDRPTTAKTRVMAGSHQVARVDAERAGPLPPEVERALLDAIDEAAGRCDAVLLSDYGKGVVSEAVAARAIEAARGQDLPVVVDPKGLSFKKYEGATVITPNELEARQAAGTEDGVALDAVAERIGGLLPGSSLLITRGADGMALYPGGGDRLDVAAIAHRVHDVTGAGDTVAAVLVVALAAGVEKPLAVRLANTAASEAVQQVGVARVSGEQLRRSIERESDDPADAPAAGP